MGKYTEWATGDGTRGPCCPICNSVPYEVRTFETIPEIMAYLHGHVFMAYARGFADGEAGEVGVVEAADKCPEVQDAKEAKATGKIPPIRSRIMMAHDAMECGNCGHKFRVGGALLDKINRENPPPNFDDVK